MEDLTIRVVAQVEEAKKQIAQVQSLAEKAGAKRYRVEFRADYAEMRRQMAKITQTRLEIQAEIKVNSSKLTELNRWLANNQGAQGTAIYEQVEQMAAAYAERLAGLREAEQKAADEQKYLNAQMQEGSATMRKNAVEADAFGVAYRRAKTEVVQLGSQLQSAGRALTSFGGIFTRFFSGAIMGAGYQALNKLTAGFSGAFSRSDTFSTYEKILKAMGHDASKEFAIGTNKSATALENLEQAVLGLPTGLDEITEAQKGYLAVSGDIEKATKTAIAANNTFLASDTDSRNRNRARKQLNNLLAGTEMTKARWQAIVESMPLAVDAVGKQLGYKGEEAIKEFRKSLLEGKIDNQDFLNAFLEVGTTGAIADATEEMKHTYSAAFANWENATKRMGANVIDALSETLKKSTGKDLIDYLNDVKLAVNDISTEVQDWIRANPQKILEVFEFIKKFNVVDILKGVASAVSDVAGVIKQFMPNLDGNKIGKIVVYASALGRFLTIFGGLVKGFATPAALIGTALGGWEGDNGILGLFSRLASHRKAIRSAGEAVEAVEGVGTAAATAGLTWQKVASRAISFAAIPAIAGSMLLMAKAFKEVQGLSLDFGQIQKFVGNSLLAITEFAAYAEGLGLLLSSTPLGWMAAIGEGVGVAAILALAGTMAAVAESMEKVTRVQIPSKSRIDTVMTAFKSIIPSIQDVVNSLAGNKGIIVGWTKKSEAKSAKNIVESFSSILDTFIGMTDSLTKLSEVENVKDKIEKAASKIEALGDGLKPLKDAITKAFGSYEQDFVEQGGQRVQKRFDETAASEYAEMTSAFGQILYNIGNLVDKFLDMRKKINKVMKGNVNFAEFGARMKGFISEINALIMDENGLYSLSTNSKNWVKEEGITNLSNAFYSITVLIDRINEISGKSAEVREGSTTLENVYSAVHGISQLAQLMVNTSTFPNAENIGGKLERLSEAFDKMMLIPNKIRLIASAIGTGLENDFQKVKDFFTANKFKDFEDIIVSVSVLFDVDMGDALTTVYNAVFEKWESITKVLDTMNLTKERTVKVKFNPDVEYLSVITQIRAAEYAINEALRWTNIPKNRTVTINLNPKVNKGAVPNDFFHNGGLVYRAGGGSIFRPRGTDTVPAMLTAGEWVMRTSAVKKFGTEFMDRVNNLDIGGALRALHARVGSAMTTSQRTIINNNHTDNRSYSNVQNISTNNPNFAFRRSRWVSELR